MMVTVFDNKTFAISSNDTLYALDAFTGQILWQTGMPFSARGIGTEVGAYKIDDHRLVVPHTQGFMCFSVDNGTLLWATNNTYVRFGQALGSPFIPFMVDTATETIYTRENNPTWSNFVISALDLSNPAQPPSRTWSYQCIDQSEIMAYGDGKLFCGTSGDTVFALNANTGKLIWTTQDKGERLYSGSYYEGNLYAGQSSNLLSCYDGNTGKILWSYSAGPLGFFAWGGATAYGRYFQHNIRQGGTFVSCWDATTGQTLWENNNPQYFLGHLQPVVADGKVYITTNDGGGLPGGINSGNGFFSCLDAFTGTILWTIRGAFNFPAIAYGNLYAASGTDNAIICFGSPQPWSMWRGNTAQPGVAVGQSAPAKLNLRWEFAANGPITSSPSIVDGKVFVGSHDGNLYCIDAYSGGKIWNFTINSQYLSSPAVVNGKVYTGADDGNIYCLDESTGKEIWKTSAGGYFPVVFATLWQPRSSPIIVGNQLFVGGIDGKVYCLNTSDGSIEWTYQTGQPIGGSPAYSNGTVYIASCDTYLYALNAANGAFVWKFQLPVRMFGATPGTRHIVCSPIIVGSTLYIGSGAPLSSTLNITAFFALNANSGSIIWSLVLNSTSYPSITPTYANGVLYFAEGPQFSAYNATTHTRIWNVFQGIDTFASGAYASGEVFFGSDLFTFYALNATSGAKLGFYDTGAEIMSSPAVWGGKVYVGSSDWNIYCFDDTPSAQTSISATPSQTQINFKDSETVSGQLSPGIPNATVAVVFTKPDTSTVSVATTTDLKGSFSVSYVPDAVGVWSWIAKYDGNQLPVETYASSSTSSTQLKVAQTASTPTPSTPPTPTPNTSTPPPSSPSLSPSPSPSPTVVSSPPPAISYTQAAIVAAIFVLIIIIVSVLFVRKTK
jgi:outer membrane protein assembly factor BamB